LCGDLHRVADRDWGDFSVLGENEYNRLNIKHNMRIYSDNNNNGINCHLGYEQVAINSGSFYCGGRKSGELVCAPSDMP
jgi:hypothetical protein